MICRARKKESIDRVTEYCLVGCQTLADCGRVFRLCCFIMASKQALLASFYYLIAMTVLVDCEMFTALSHLQRLVNIEMELSDALDDYIAEQEARLRRLKIFSQDVNVAMEQAKSNRDKYIGHPVNTYLMVKRFVKDWPVHVKSVEQEGDSEGMSGGHNDFFRQFGRFRMKVLSILKFCDDFFGIHSSLRELKFYLLSIITIKSL